MIRRSRGEQFGLILAASLGFGFASLLIGGIGGMIAGALLSDSGQGPLLGLFVTGPVAAIAGALVGMLFAGRRSEVSVLWSKWCALLLIWVVALLYTLAVIPMGFVAVGAFCQALAVATGGWLILKSTGGSTSSRLAMPVLLVALFAVLLLTLFPPVVPPSWGQPPRQSSAPNPRFAFIHDARLDASHHVPELTIYRPALFRNWMITIGLATSGCLVITALRRFGR